MAVLPLVYAPNPLLKKISKPVEKVDDDLRKFMDDMLHTMYAEQGLGLASVQVGVLKRVLVMDSDWNQESAQGISYISSFQEIKTTWHPIEQIGGVTSSY